MGRETSRMITFNDAIYMVQNEGFTALDTIPSSNQVMKRSAIEYYLDVDTSQFTGYTIDRVIPYQLIKPRVVADNTVPVFTSDLYLSDEGYEFLMCHWTATDNVGIDYQQLFYRVFGTSTYSNILLPASTVDYRLDGLQNDTTYQVFVRVYDAAGNFRDSSVASRKTLAGTAPSDTTAPTFTSQPTKGSGSTSTSLVVNWGYSDNVGVTSQRFYYKVSSSTGAYNQVNLTTQSTYTISGLTSSTFYDVYVVLFDAAGNSKTSTLFSFQTEASNADTTKPIIGTLSFESKTETSVSLSWTHATDANGISTYRVLWRTTGTGGWAAVDKSSTTTNATIFELTAGTSYEFYMVASDPSGNWSNNSNTVTVSTDSAPTNTQNNSATLSAGYTTQSLAASANTIGATVYFNGIGIPDVGGYVYTSSAGTTGYNGNNYYYKVLNTDFVVGISSNGQITSKVNTGQTLSISPTSKSVASSGSSYTISVTSNTSWVASDNVSWSSVSPSSGTGNGIITVTYATNSLSASRSGTITVRTSDNYLSRSSSLSQSGTAPTTTTYVHSLGYNSSNYPNSCSALRITRYTNHFDFASSTKIYSDSTGNGFAFPGYYSNGSRSLYWNGTSVTSSTLCGFS